MLGPVSIASVWTNSVVIVGELHSRATPETLKQQSETSALKCVCVDFIHKLSLYSVSITQRQACFHLSFFKHEMCFYTFLNIVKLVLDCS